MELKLLQTEFLYSVKDDHGREFTVSILEDWDSVHIEYDVFNQDGEIIEDETIILRIIHFIESNRN